MWQVTTEPAHPPSARAKRAAKRENGESGLEGIRQFLGRAVTATQAVYQCSVLGG